MRYTFSDDEEDSDDFPSRRSNRNSEVSTTAEHAGPTVTASGRHVKSRLGGMYGETMLVDQRKELESEREERETVTAGVNQKDQIESSGQRRSSGRPSRPLRAPRRLDDSSEDMNGHSDASSSGIEWSGNEAEPDEKDAEEFEADGVGDDDDDEMSANDSDIDEEPPEQDSLVVQLRYKKEGNSVKSKGRSDLKNGDEAIADCIAVGSGQLAKIPDATMGLNGEASKHYQSAPKPNGPLQSLPIQSVNGTSSQLLGASSETLQNYS